MIKQIVFIIFLLVTLGIFSYSVFRYYLLFRLTKPAYPIRDLFKRIWITLKVAFGQTVIFRRPVIGFIHALVFWGFCFIILGSIEMVVDGIFGTEHYFKFAGWFYNTFSAIVDIFSFLVAFSVIIFLFRRMFLKIRRFTGIEMKKEYKKDALIALGLILLLMVSLIGMNIFYCKLHSNEMSGFYPMSRFFAGSLDSVSENKLSFFYEASWWSHILLIFFFANYLPYSKHFHVFMSVPSVFLSKIEPLGKIANMDNITREVKLMMNPEVNYAEVPAEPVQERFGILDAEDVSWKNFLDSLSCTQCGRCTSVCPANITGKKLSPRKLFIDLRHRMNEKGMKLVKQGLSYTDNKSLIKDVISEEELWACTTCNACAKECPVKIDHPSFIIDMRRYLVMEKGSAPGEIKAIFSNIENNGAPWQYSREDRMLWAN